MPQPSYRALLLDIDGTLIGDSGKVEPYTVERLQLLQRRGVMVLIATGRSESFLLDVTRPLGIETPVICYNGAAIFDPLTERLEVTHPLSVEVVEGAVELCRNRSELYAVCMVPGAKFAAPPRSAAEAEVLESFHSLQFVAQEDLPTSGLIRVSIFSEAHESSEQLAHDVSQSVPRPHYLTHFPLNLLPPFRHRRTQVLDLHAPCQGKAEALSLLEQRYDIGRQQVVAVGDAENDRPMIEQAGLGVAMGNAVETIRATADRVIGPCGSPTIGELVDELFFGGFVS